MLQMFYPTQYLDSVEQIAFDRLYQEGCRGVIFDIDNTLVPHGAPADRRSIALIKRLQKTGFRVMMLSNNKEPRVKPFCDTVGTPYLYKANKPFPGSYRKAMERMGTTEKTTLFIGDQLFTDIWGAKRTGIRTFLVRPIHPKEEIQIVLKRFLEKIVLYFYEKERGKR